MYIHVYTMYNRLTYNRACPTHIYTHTHTHYTCYGGNVFDADLFYVDVVHCALLCVYDDCGDGDGDGDGGCDGHVSSVSAVLQDVMTFSPPYVDLQSSGEGSVFQQDVTMFSLLPQTTR